MAGFDANEQKRKCMDNQKRKDGSLKVLEVPNRSHSGPYVILFHGYGANANDLFSFSQILDPSRQATWLFPEGHLDIYFDPSYSGRAWFPVDIDALQNARMRGEESHLTRKTPEGLSQARDLVKKMLEDRGIPMSQVILGGFSQGAMLATELSLTASENPAGLLILSGTLLDEDRWTQLASKHKGLPFIQSHGDNDPLLSLQDAKKLEKVLVDAGMRGQLYTFNGGHEIPEFLLRPLSQFIHTYLPTS
jgi:phospholipase/carboxylesterase